MELALLLLAGFFAGLVDAVAGGGGLIQLPAFLLFMPTSEAVVVLASNKLASTLGTSAATWAYFKASVIDWRKLAPTLLLSFFMAALGAYFATVASSNFMRPLVLILLVAVALFISFKPELGQFTGKTRGAKALDSIWALFFGAVIGFYDGFFGPGTGTFLIFIFVIIFGLDFLQSSAAAKAINLSTNLGALILFMVWGKVQYELGLLVGVCNLLGGYIGSRLAILKGSGFVRKVFLLVIWGTLLRLMLKG